MKKIFVLLFLFLGLSLYAVTINDILPSKYIKYSELCDVKKNKIYELRANATIAIFAKYKPFACEWTQEQKDYVDAIWAEELLRESQVVASTDISEINALSISFE